MVGRKVVAAIPCFNEERFIGSVVLKAKEQVDEVVVIDDGSTDGTVRVAEAAGAVVVRQERNLGKGVAISTAFKWAREDDVDALVLLDGDGQHEPTEIPLLLQPILEGKADMVVGSRFIGGTTRVPRYRRLGQRALNLITSLGSGVRLSDSQSGFRSFSRRAIGVLSFKESGLSVESEMQFLAKISNLKTAEVPISVGYKDKPKRNPLSQGMGVVNRVLAMISQWHPLIFFGVPGAVLLVGGILLGVDVVIDTAATGVLSVGSTMLAVLLCLIGIFAVFTGIMLHAVSIMTFRRPES